MKRLLLAALSLSLSALLFGCPNNGNNNTQPDAGDDGGIDNTQEPIIKVSGTAQVHPAAAAFYKDGGVPSLDGVTLRIEEPLIVGLGGQAGFDGVFGTQVLDGGGSFSIGNVDTSQIILGLAAGFVDTPDAGFIRGASTVWDVKREGNSKPRVDLNNVKAYAIPKALVDQLNQVIGASTINSASGQLGNTLMATGFAFIQIVDAAGNPMPNVQIGYACGVSCVSVSGDQFFYPNADFSQVTSATNGGQTSSNGVVIYVGNNTQAHQISITVQGHSDYPAHAAGAAPGAGLAVTVHP